jgi:CRP-like cAMP-binding protein
MDFSRLPRRVLDRNETLFCEGDPGDEMYLLLTGELGVFRHGERLALLNQPLAILGEMSALTGAPRAATVQALRRSTLIAVDDPENLFAEYPQLGFKLARLLADRLGGTLGRLAALKDRWTDGQARTAAAPKPTPRGPLPQAATKPGATPELTVDFDSDTFSSDVLDALDTIFDQTLVAGGG